MVLFKSMTPLKIEVFKSKATGMFKIVGITIDVIKKVSEIDLEIDQIKYQHLLDKNKINLKEYGRMFSLKPKADVVYVKDQKKFSNGEILRVIGNPDSGVIELSYINKITKNQEIRLSVGQFIEFKKIFINILGNKLKYIEKE